MSIGPKKHQKTKKKQPQNICKKNLLIMKFSSTDSGFKQRWFGPFNFFSIYGVRTCPIQFRIGIKQ